MKSTTLREVLGYILPWTEKIDDEAITKELIFNITDKIEIGDLQLEPSLGVGSTAASLILLEVYHNKSTNLGTVERALSTVVQAARGMKFNNDELAWTEHMMSVHAIRKHMVQRTQIGSYDATDDIPPQSYFAKSDIWRFEKYISIEKLPPGMCSLMVLSLLDQDEESSRVFFEQTFARSEPVCDALLQMLIPVEFLNDIRQKDEPKGRRLMLKMLENFIELDNDALGRLLQVLLGNEHSAAKHIGNEEIPPDLPLLAEVMRYTVKLEDKHLKRFGEHLFGAIFVSHNGFPGEWTCPKALTGLPIDILRNIIKTEDYLQLVRNAVLEHVEKNINLSISRFSEIWEYCHWPLCQDDKLIKRAIDFLSAICEARPEEQSEVFPLYTRLQFWRLPAHVFMTPYIPAQLLTSHVVSLYRKLVEEVSVLQRSHVSNMAEINTLRRTLGEVATR